MKCFRLLTSRRKMVKQQGEVTVIVECEGMFNRLEIEKGKVDK